MTNLSFFGYLNDLTDAHHCTKVCEDWPKTGWSCDEADLKRWQGRGGPHTSESMYWTLTLILWQCRYPFVQSWGTHWSHPWYPVKTICRQQPRAFLTAQTPGQGHGDLMKKHADLTNKVTDVTKENSDSTSLNQQSCWPTKNEDWTILNHWQTSNIRCVWN